MRVTSLFIYPVKSLRGTPVETFEMTTRGPLHDREWMLVDASTGVFLSQRATPQLARFEPTLRSTGVLSIRSPSSETQLEVPVLADHGRRDVTVWKDRFSAIDCGDEPARWFSRAVGTGCRLVRMADDVSRRLDPSYVRDPAAQTGFADGYPVLVTNQASLDELNARLERPVPMNRFRPNVVVSGPNAWAEDTWARLDIGRVGFDAVKPCARCTVITTDQFSGERPGGKEPLETLASHRTRPSMGATFGMNLVPKMATGTLRVGDPLTVLQYREPHG